MRVHDSTAQDAEVERAMRTIDRDTTNRIAAQWLDAWSSRDAKAVVQHLADDVPASSSSSPAVTSRCAA